LFGKLKDLTDKTLKLIHRGKYNKFVQSLSIEDNSVTTTSLSSSEEMA